MIPRQPPCPSEMIPALERPVLPGAAGERPVTTFSLARHLARLRHCRRLPRRRLARAGHHLPAHSNGVFLHQQGRVPALLGPAQPFDALILLSVEEGKVLGNRLCERLEQVLICSSVSGQARFSKCSTKVEVFSGSPMAKATSEPAPKTPTPSNPRSSKWQRALMRAVLSSRADSLFRWPSSQCSWIVECTLVRGAPW